MAEVKRSALVAAPQERMFRLINDVEQYPAFVPWCQHARIVSASEREIVATLGVKRGPLQFEFTTRNMLHPHDRIDLVLENKGLLRSLAGSWLIVPVGEAGCRIELTLRFEFTNRLSAAVFEPLFGETAASLVDAFVARARTDST
ncbi:MAG: type II toxin-antitoxin system RatA family toxin [Steroidobacteraceae bacterium]